MHMFTWVFPKIGDFPPKWMVKIMENPMNKWDDLGGISPTYFRKGIHILLCVMGLQSGCDSPTVFNSLICEIRSILIPGRWTRKRRPGSVWSRFLGLVKRMPVVDPVRSAKLPHFFLKIGSRLKTSSFTCYILLLKPNVGGQLALLVQYLPKSSDGIGILENKKCTTFLLQTGKLQDIPIFFSGISRRFFWLDVQLGQDSLIFLCQGKMTLDDVPWISDVCRW